MPEKPLPPLLFPATTSSERARLVGLKRQGKVRAIGPRLYTSVPEEEVDAAVRVGWASIVANLFPRALLSHSSALTYLPTRDGEIFLTGPSNRTVKYPGLHLTFMRGPKALETDVDFQGFKASSLPRALMENLASLRGKNRRRNLPQEEIEKRLERILQLKGESEINKIHDASRTISKKLGWSEEFKKLDELLGAMLGTKSAAALQSPLAKSRALGKPYDSPCLERLQTLFADLRHQPLPEIKETHRDPEHFINKAFFEAYFSNYIEGTTFEIEEAEEIIFDKKIPAKRPKDAHDILGTFKIVADPEEMKRVPAHAPAFLGMLLSRHQRLLAKRPEIMPGQFKEKANRAGNTHFVPPEYMIGTLEKGFDLYKDLPAGLPRAIYVMFLVAEVHPFKDGNGRIARIMMNAELFSQKLATIIIPTVYREDYLLALRALSRRNRSQPLTQMLVKAQTFSHLDFSQYPRILQHLKSHRWFSEAEDSKILM